MAQYGFEVQKHYSGLETAWRAEFKHRCSSNNSNSQPKTLGLNSEMDALPGVGHACGHNLIGIAGVAVALAAKTVLEKHDLDGNIVLLGTPGELQIDVYRQYTYLVMVPAEEGGAGKVRLIEGGAYKDMDICLMCHPGPGPKLSSGVGPSLALNRLDVEYFGHTYEIHFIFGLVLIYLVGPMHLLHLGKVKMLLMQHSSLIQPSLYFANK